MADTFTTMDGVAQAALIEFHNNLGIIPASNRSYEKDVVQGSWDKGGRVKIRKPNRHLVGNGATIGTVPDTTERFEWLGIDYRKHVVMDFTTQDLTLSARHDFKARFITPGVIDLANTVESIVATKLADELTNFTGTAGVAPASFADLTRTKAYLNKLAIPETHTFAMNEDNYAELISIANLQNAFTTPLNKEITRRYMAGYLSAMDILHSVLIPPHIAGVGDSTATPANGFVAAGTIKTNVASGATTLTITGLGASEAGVFLAGDKIYVEGFYSVNPLERDISTGEYIKMTVTEDVDSDVSGDATVPIKVAGGLSSNIISDTASPYRNVSAQITATAPVYLATANTAVGSTGKVAYKRNAAFHKDGIQFVAPPLVIPDSVVPKAAGRATDSQTGISIRLLQVYNGLTDVELTRMDIIFGIKINPEYIVGFLG